MDRFTIQQTKEIRQSWLGHSKDSNLVFPNRLFPHAETLKELTDTDAVGPTEDCYAAFRAYGLEEDLIGASINEEFQDLHLIESALS